MSDQHPGKQPVEPPRAEEALRESRASDANRRDAIAGTRNAPRPALAAAGAIMLLTAAVFSLGVQVLYAHTPTGQDNAARVLGLGILAGLAGLRVLLTPGPHPVASGVALATGATFVLLASLSEHAETQMAVIEAITGMWVFLAAAFCLDSHSRSSESGR